MSREELMEELEECSSEYESRYNDYEDWSEIEVTGFDSKEDLLEDIDGCWFEDSIRDIISENQNVTDWKEMEKILEEDINTEVKDAWEDCEKIKKRIEEITSQLN